MAKEISLCTWYVLIPSKPPPHPILTTQQAVQQGRAKITAYLLSLNPTLLHRENATGRTPLEMARDIYLATHVAHPTSLETHARYFGGQADRDLITNTPAAEFVPPPPRDPTEEVGHEGEKATFDACVAVDGRLVGEGAERNRRLVSLYEANEVARRLGRGRGGRQAVVNGYLVEDAKPDIVSEWIHSV
jgi:hypothetical protein